MFHLEFRSHVVPVVMALVFCMQSARAEICQQCFDDKRADCRTACESRESAACVSECERNRCAKQCFRKPGTTLVENGATVTVVEPPEVVRKPRRVRRRRVVKS